MIPSETFCPLPWMHLSAKPSGEGRICCNGNDGTLKDSWEKVQSIDSYFNSDEYKKFRLQMLRGERPNHCRKCFEQEDNGVESSRKYFLKTYQKYTTRLLEKTNYQDGTITDPEVYYIDIPMGNKCNLKCRMCSPWSSNVILKDWKILGKGKAYHSKMEKWGKSTWYLTPNFFNFIAKALPFVEMIFLEGGEPLISKGHLPLLKMIIDSNNADHIILNYNSNQTIIPPEVVSLWKKFKRIVFNCSVEGVGSINDYIRYPAKWEKLEKNLLLLDEIAADTPHIDIFIHSTLQAYNVFRVTDLLDYFRLANFKKIYRFPFFIWVSVPAWLCPTVLPGGLREKFSRKIEKYLDREEDFFLNYHPHHREHNSQRMAILRGFCQMIRDGNEREEDFLNFIEETKAHDRLRGQSVIQVLPELSSYFK